MNHIILFYTILYFTILYYMNHVLSPCSQVLGLEDSHIPLLASCFFSRSDQPPWGLDRGGHMGSFKGDIGPQKAYVGLYWQYFGHIVHIFNGLDG